MTLTREDKNALVHVEFPIVTLGTNWLDENPTGDDESQERFIESLLAAGHIICAGTIRVEASDDPPGQFRWRALVLEFGKAYLGQHVNVWTKRVDPDKPFMHHLRPQAYLH